LTVVFVKPQAVVSCVLDHSSDYAEDID
jgi:hypothetical protein